MRYRLTRQPLWLELSVAIAIKLLLLWGLAQLLPHKLSHDEAAQGVSQRLLGSAALPAPSTLSTDKDAP